MSDVSNFNGYTGRHVRAAEPKPALLLGGMQETEERTDQEGREMTEEKANAKEAQKPAPTATIKIDSWRACGLTHREPDSFELIAREMGMDAYDYCDEYGIGYSDDDEPAEYSMHADLVRRMKAVAARDCRDIGGDDGANGE